MTQLTQQMSVKLDLEFERVVDLPPDSILAPLATTEHSVIAHNAHP